MLKQQARLIARIVYLVDLALTSAAFFAAFFIRDLFLPRVAPYHFPTGLFPLSDYLRVYPLVLVIWSVLLFSHHSYHSHRTISLVRETLTILRVVLVGNVLLATCAFLFSLTQLSRSWFLLFGFLSAIFVVAEKILLRVIARYVRSKGLNYRTVIIVGTGRRAIDVARMIVNHKYWGYKILGFVTDGHHLPNGWARYRVLGAVPDLKRVLERPMPEPIDEIVFAVTRKKLDEMKQIFLMCEELGIRTRVAMNFFPNRVARLEVEELEGIPFLTFTTTPSNETQLAAKRLLDVSVSMGLLVLGAPIIFLAAIAIRLTSPGSVLFKQERIVLNGRIFTLYKFRTMIADAHERRA
jgi:FlaA1/EpsC-like NDP-sugar epimerase